MNVTKYMSTLQNLPSASRVRVIQITIKALIDGIIILNLIPYGAAWYGSNRSIDVRESVVCVYKKDMTEIHKTYHYCTRAKILHHLSWLNVKNE